MAGFNAMQQAQAARANDKVRRETLQQIATLRNTPVPSFEITPKDIQSLAQRAKIGGALTGTLDSEGENFQRLMAAYIPLQLQARGGAADYQLGRERLISQMLSGVPAYPTFPMTGDPFSSMMGVAGSMEAMKLIRQMIGQRGAGSPYGTPMGYEDPGLIGAEEPVGPAGSGGQPSPEQFYRELFGGSGRGGGWE